MNIPDTQGHLGNLELKPYEELESLLQRQEMLLRNKKFLNNLPDKGQKILQLVCKIRKILDEKKPVDQTTELFEQMAVDEEQRKKVAIESSIMTDSVESRCDALEADDTDDGLLNMASRSESDKCITDKRTHDHTCDHTCVDGYVNNYAKVISKSEEPPHKFIPSKNVKEHLMDNLNSRQHGEKLSQPSSSSTETSKHTSNLKGLRYDESLMFHTDFNPKFQAAKVISVGESIRLQQEQQKRSEELLAQHAAERLSQKTPFNPEGTSFFGYRNPPEDSDDEDEEGEKTLEDYPD